MNNRDKLSFCVGLQIVPPAEAMLTAGEPIKNPQALLRNALPINNKPIREIQVSNC